MHELEIRYDIVQSVTCKFGCVYRGLGTGAGSLIV